MRLFAGLLVTCLALAASAKHRAVDREDRADRRDAREQKAHDASGQAFDREEAREKSPCERGSADCVCPVGAEGPGSLPRGPACFPAFESDVSPLPAALRERMRGRSWHEGCPVAPDALSVLTVATWDLAGHRQKGRLVVAAKVADDVRDAFRRLYEARFPVERMEPIDAFDGDDDASMAANNTTSFNCRVVKGTTRISRHSEGEAVDLNPLMNPFVHDGAVEPPGGREWLPRQPKPGLIVADGVAVRAFEAVGWKWGGNWKKAKDYQHFSRAGD